MSDPASLTARPRCAIDGDQVRRDPQGNMLAVCCFEDHGVNLLVSESQLRTSVRPLRGVQALK
jgi:hypothetical protein